MSKAFITGLSGTTLTGPERDFIRAERPWGFILFRRNIDTPAQVAALTAEIKAALGEADVPVDRKSGV